MIVGGEAGVFYSPDGTNWFPEETGIGAVDFRDFHAIGAIVGTERGAFLINDQDVLYETEDGGRTWHERFSPEGSSGCGGIAFVKTAFGSRLLRAGEPRRRLSK